MYVHTHIHTYTYILYNVFEICYKIPLQPDRCLSDALAPCILHHANSLSEYMPFPPLNDEFLLTQYFYDYVSLSLSLLVFPSLSHPSLELSIYF